jgi:hypothetical protein
MESPSQPPVEYGRVQNALSSIVGILGFLFCARRYPEERWAHRELGERERQSKKTLSRLAARDLERHPATV